MEATQSIIKLFLEGNTVREIARKVNYSTSTIRNELRKNNFKLQDKYHKTPVPKNKVINDYKNGISINDLSVKYDRASQIIRKILREANVIKKKRVRNIQITKNELVELIKQDKSLNYMSKYFRCSESTITKYIKKFELPSLRKIIYFTPQKGDKFHNLEFLEEKKEKNNRMYWLCKCDCGNKKLILAKSIIKEFTKSCGCLKAIVIRGNRYNGYEDISGHFWSSLKQSAKIRNIPLSLSIGYLWDLFLKQNKKCSLTNLTLSFYKTDINSDTIYQASLDRIDSKKGYEPGNVQWVAKEINLMKWKLPQDEFIKLCFLITEQFKIIK